MIFNMALRGDLEHGEHVETDSGYKGALPDVNCPEFTDCEQEVQEFQHLEGHDVSDHQAVFGAVACLVQLSFEHGEPLFQVDYQD